MAKDWKSMERVVAKLLGTWWGCEFRRTPSSGAWSKFAQRDQVGADFHGDIVAPPRAKFPFSVECKAYEHVDFYQSLYGKANLFEWWAQCREDAKRAGKLPMLIMRENRKQEYLVGVQVRDYQKLLAWCSDLSNIPSMTLQYVYKGRWSRVAVINLKTFVAVVSKSQVQQAFGLPS